MQKWVCTVTLTSLQLTGTQLMDCKSSSTDRCKMFHTTTCCSFLDLWMCGYVIYRPRHCSCILYNSFLWVRVCVCVCVWKKSTVLVVSFYFNCVAIRSYIENRVQCKVFMSNTNFMYHILSLMRTLSVFLSVYPCSDIQWYSLRWIILSMN